MSPAKLLFRFIHIERYGLGLHFTVAVDLLGIFVNLRKVKQPNSSELLWLSVYRADETH